jgi:hypothetical protein
VVRVLGVGRDRALIKYQKVGSPLGFVYKLFPFYYSFVYSDILKSNVRFNSNIHSHSHSPNLQSYSPPNHITYNSNNRSLIISGREIL